VPIQIGTDGAASVEAPFLLSFGPFPQLPEDYVKERLALSAKAGEHHVLYIYPKPCSWTGGFGLFTL
jgi:hypothetical protein